jgi:signal transduction histidine kinase
MLFLPIWWFGNTLRKSREQTALLRERTEQLVREREENARRAVVDERIRIARELHDGVAQSLGYLNLKTKQVNDLVSSQKTVPALNELSDVRKVVQDTYDDIRVSIGFLQLLHGFQSNNSLVHQNMVGDATDGILGIVWVS